MKKSLLILLMLFTFINVYALDNYVSERGINCGGVDVLIKGVLDSGKIIVVDDDGNFYSWKEDNTCTLATNQDILDLINLEYTYYEQNYDTSIDEYQINFAWDSYYILNDEEYDSEETYYSYNELTGDMEEVDNVEVSNINTYYVLKYFKSPTSTVIDENIVYYEEDYDNEYNVTILKKVDNPIEDDVIYYFIETNLDEIIKTKKTYTYDEELYNNIILDFDYTNLNVIDGNLYVYAYNLTEQGDGVLNCAYFDINGNEVLEYRNKYIVTTDNYKIIYNCLEREASIYTKDDIFIKTYTFSYTPYIVGNGLYEINGNLYFVENKEDTLSNIYVRKYTVLDGDNQELDNSNKDLVVRFNGNYGLFNKLLINGEEVDESNYTKKEGSTIITLKSSYIKTLKNGNYTMTAVYTDGGNATTTFTLNFIDNPNTGDNIIFYILLLSISLMNLIILRKRIN